MMKVCPDKRLILLFLAAFFTLSTPSRAIADFPPSLQLKLKSLLNQDVHRQLQTGMARYNSSLGKSNTWLESATKAGFSHSDVLAFEKYFSDRASGLRQEAKWQDGQILLQENIHRITINPDDFREQSIRVDGQIFRWNRKLPVEENLRVYVHLFKNRQSSWAPFFISTAYADELFRIQVSGLQLYFTVSAVGDVGGELYRLNATVKEMIGFCEAPEPAPGENDPFQKAILEGKALSQNTEDSQIHRLRNCADIKTYASHPVGTLMGEPVLPKSPADLCANLNRLATCVHQQMDPPQASGAKSKPPTDRQEWYEPGTASPEKAGTAQ